MPYSVKKTARIKSGQSLKSNKINHTTASFSFTETRHSNLIYD